MTDETAVPRFRRGIKFRLDTVRDAWVLLAPEKLFLPDETATEILKLVDGDRSVGVIVDDLVGRFNAPRELIAADVLATLRGLAVKGTLEF